MKSNTFIFFGALMGACIVFNANGQPSDAPNEPESDFPEQGMIPNPNMLHIGIVVRDIEAAMAHWTRFLGLDERPNTILTENNKDNPTVHRGHPSNFKARLAFFTLENLQVELIEPLGDDPSHWREFLETKGEGVHHIAFSVKGLGEQYFENYEANGMGVIQRGGWDGGEYGYMDTIEALGVTVELLEFYNRD